MARLVLRTFPSEHQQMDQAQPAKWKSPRYRRNAPVRVWFLWRELRGCWYGITVLVWFFVLPLRSEQPAALPEHQLKAVFLLKFLKYVEWPPTLNASTNSPLEIVHVSENAFGDDVVSLVQSKIIDGRTVVLKHSDVPADWKGGRILFVSDSERRRLPEIVQAVKGLPVLTVGESENFLEQGGMINFVVKERKVRLEINLVAAEAAGLKVSSRLLAVADTVKRK